MDYEPTDKERELITAIQMGRLDLVEACLKGAVGIYSCLGYSGERPLHIAAQCGQAAIIDWLVSKGAPVDAEDERGETPLFYAVAKGAVDAALALIKHGANPNHAGGPQRTPIFAAVTRNDAAMIEALIEKGADPNAVARGSTPLHYAAGGGHAEAARALVANGARVELRNEQGETAADVAERSRDRFTDKNLITAFLGAAHVEKQATAGTENAIQISKPLKFKPQER